MITHADKSQDNKNQSVSAAESLKKSSSESALQFVDNRPEALAQRKMQEMADNRPEGKEVAQMQAIVAKHSALKNSISHSLSMNKNDVLQGKLYFDPTSPFTAAEALIWNNLETVANGLGVGGSFISQVEQDIYDPTTGITIANSTPTLKTQIKAAILTRQIAKTDADSLNWGDFQPLLAKMSTQYGTLIGPRSTGGHASQTYTYTVNGNSHDIAEETDAHGKKESHLKTRRGEMKNAIDDFNAEVVADAGKY